MSELLPTDWMVEDIWHTWEKMLACKELVLQLDTEYTLVTRARDLCDMPVNMSEIDSQAMHDALTIALDKRCAGSHVHTTLARICNRWQKEWFITCYYVISDGYIPLEQQHSGASHTLVLDKMYDRAMEYHMHRNWTQYIKHIVFEDN